MLKHFVYRLTNDGKKKYTEQLSSFSDLEYILETAYEEDLKDNPKKNLLYTIWSCVGGRNNPKELKYFYLDLDCVDLNKFRAYIYSISSILDVDSQELGVVCTGRGLHMYLALDEPIPLDEWQYWRKIYTACCNEIHERCKKYSLNFEKDTCYDTKRLLRVPNTENYNEKKDPKSVFSVVINPTIGKISRRKLEELADLKEQDIPISEFENNGDVGHFKNKKCIEFLWNNPPRKGQRHEIILRLISHEIKCGTSFEDLESKLSVWCMAYDVDPEDGLIRLRDLWKRCENNDVYDYGCNDRILSKHCKKECLIHPEQIEKRKQEKSKKKEPVKRKEILLEGIEYIAHELIKKHGGIISEQLNTTTNKVIYKYNGKYYERYLTDLIVYDIFIIKKQTEYPWTDQKIRTNLGNILLAISEMQSFPSMIPLEEMNTGQRYLNCSNGVLCLETMTLKKHDPKYPLFYCLNVKFDPSKKKATKFKEFLRNLTNGDEKKELLLKEILAIPMHPNQVDKMFWIYGPSGTGKSTFVDVIKHLYGKENCSSNTLPDINSKFGRDNLINKVANISSEGSSGVLNSTKIKAIVCGEEVPIHRKFLPTISARINAKMIFVFNDRPVFNEKTDAISRRLIQVCFDRIVTDHSNMELGYAKKLIEDEGSDILNIAIEAYKSLRDRSFDFTSTKQSLDANKDLRASGDVLYDFMTKYLEQGVVDEDIVPKKWVSDAFYRLCATKAIKRSNVLQKDIQEAILDHFDSVELKRTESVVFDYQQYNRKLCYHGLRVKDMDTIKDDME